MLRASGSIAIAVSDTMLYLASGETWALEPRASGARSWPALQDALRELAGSSVRSATRSLVVTILPPLTQLRTIPLPKMRDGDVQAILGRTVQKYFPNVREPQTIAISPWAGSGTDGAYTVVAAPGALLIAIEDSATAAGLTVERIVPAYASWSAAAMRQAAHGQRTDVSVVIARADGGDDVLRVVDGIPREIRRHRERVSASANMIRLATPQTAAARFGVYTDVLQFVTPNQLRRRTQHRRATLQNVAAMAAVVLVAVGAGLYVRAERESREIDRERALIRPRVDSAARVQAAVAALTAPARALAGVEEHGPRWSMVVAELGDVLPADAYVEGVRTSGDSIAIDGAAKTGARVFQAVGASSLLANVAPAGAIRRETAPDSSGAIERFTLTARIAHAVRLVPKPTRGTANGATGGVAK